jgi:hypothetical protein
LSVENHAHDESAADFSWVKPPVQQHSNVVTIAARVTLEKVVEAMLINGMLTTHCNASAPFARDCFIFMQCCDTEQGAQQISTIPPAGLPDFARLSLGDGFGAAVRVCM